MSNEKAYKRSDVRTFGLISFVMGGICGAALGFLSGASGEFKRCNSLNAIHKDLTGDGRKDFALCKYSYPEIVYIQQEDGTYKHSDDVLYNKISREDQNE